MTTERMFSYNGHINEQVFKEGKPMTHRYHLANRRRFFFLMSCMGVVFILFASILSAGANSVPQDNTDFIVVMQGDTLWDIAEQHCAQGDIRSYLSEVRVLNGLDDSTIYAGQGLLLPVR